MHWYNFLHLGVSLLAVPITLGVSYVAWRRRHLPAITTFFLMIAACAAWSVAELGTMLAPSESVALFWQMPIRMGVLALVPFFFLCFALEYCGRTDWLRPRRVMLLLIIPALSEILIWTPLHDLFIHHITIARVGPLFLRQGAVFGPWFPVHRVYSYFLVGASLVLLLDRTIRSHGYYRRQAAILLAGMVIAILANTTANMTLPKAGDAASGWLDWTLAGFAVSGLAWFWALFRMGYLDVMPVALDAVFSSMNDAVIVLDKAGRIVDLNPAGSRMLGSTRRKAVGGALADLAADLASAIVQFDRQHQGGQITLGDRVLELRVSTLAGPRQDEVGTLTVLRDITDRAQMMHELDAYAHTVAHDLKNPLGIISAYVQLIREADGSPQGELANYLDRISETAHSMAEIIQGLLLLAKVRSVEEIEAEPLDMRQVVSDVLARFAPHLRETAAEISLPEHWPSARGYAPWVEEMWANYLSNALKYGGSPPQIELAADEDDRWVRFSVRDHGPGLSESARGRVFHEFERLDNKTAAGHGLGLSIVARIARKLGGEVGVDSQPGAGCTFWFTLPLA